MFNEKISYFASFKAEPEQIRLIDWLNAVKMGCSLTRYVDKYRETGLKSDKNRIPSVTVGAVCKGGHTIHHVVERTGWIAIDIDAKANPSITDWPKLRDNLATLNIVSFSSLSTSGRGVWALIKVSDPIDQENHFRALVSDFKGIEINLDTTKGKNPNDLRFYSYDPGAIIKPAIQIYTKKEPLKRIINARTLEPTPEGFSNTVFDRARTYVQRKSLEFDKAPGQPFTHGENMHDSIFHLCVFLNYKGVSRHEAEAYINSNIFPLHEIQSNCITDAYSRYMHTHGLGRDKAFKRKYEY